MRAAIYARYSSDSQREASIEDQVRLCSERLAQEGWQLTQVFSDRAMSGASTLRAGYQELLQAIQLRKLDVVVAEALDRLSRDQEDVAALFKKARFAGVRLITLPEGEITELHVGLKGTMNALFLKDLALKTHRGLRGRVEAGKSAGGKAFGYEMARRHDERGEVIRGDRQINEMEAGVVRRIFEMFASGSSPIAIAQDPERRAHSRTQRSGLARHDDPRPRRTRHGHPQERDLYWPGGLEPHAVHQGPCNRQAGLPPEPGECLGHRPATRAPHRRRRPVGAGAEPAWCHPGEVRRQ